MTWLVNEPIGQKELAARFKELVDGPDILQVAGAHDAMAALAAKQAGFKALYLSGAAYTASRGLPDLGLLYSNEVADRARDIVRATNLPLLVDIDTGYGGVINATRAAREMVEAGVAAVQLEDQVQPKKCGHLNGKALVPTEEMVHKIQAIKAAAPGLIVVARTDAYGVEGIDAAIERCTAYIAAGADALFPEALQSEAEFQAVKSVVDVPILANMTEFGKTPYFTAQEFQRMGCDFVIYPVTSLRVAAKAYVRVFEEILTAGTQQGQLENMQTRKELYETIEYEKYEQLDRKLAKTKIEDYHG
ncbi:methylisocitrate lyase [Planococcus lenghuensis]|uniref:Methylisocitrate lyase n=1 Tax=Planococcus lenghuensis TaxID=2213202 RepID=A0A1Q2KVI7_9BACL|nr:methylisocitrate lyase [Planococcus lenghuensis]AQQ52210.1 methylisocitrate lyase [Planococcus lenghuensis]